MSHSPALNNQQIDISEDDRLAFKKSIAPPPPQHQRPRGIVNSIKYMIGRGPLNEGESRTIQLGAPNGAHFPSNEVVTARYNVITFLPKFFFEAFSKFANTYFLVVCIMQAIPLISITDGVPLTLVPLSVVLFVEAIVTALEDRQRHRDDKTANSSKCNIMNPTTGETQIKLWSEVKVGDVLKVRNRDPIPADLLILASSDTPPQGVCYVETKSLDGETNLKLKQGLIQTVEGISSVIETTSGDLEHRMDLAIPLLRGEIICETPNSSLDTFSGTLSFQVNQPNGTVRGSSEPLPLGLKNILLRGCVLRSTDFVYGVVVNTGHDTKIMKSMVATRAKMSILDRTINRMLGGFLVLILTICLVMAGLAYDWHIVKTWDDVYIEEPFTVSSFFLRACTYFLLIASMIPISLYVSMKILRVCQSIFVYWDMKMVHAGLDPLNGEEFTHRSKVRTMDLCDAIGQVSYIFSDKTGTLTNNVMEFRKMSMAGSVFGLGTTIIGVAAFEREGKMEEAKRAKEFLHRVENEPHPRFINFKEAEGFAQKLTGGGIPGSREFLTALAVCHEVLVEAIKTDEGKETGKFRLSASSPDDQALVVAASEFGFKFVARGNGGRTIDVLECSPSPYILGNNNSTTYDMNAEDNRQGKMVTYELLETLEFTSTRKRASVVVANANQELFLYCKGADSEVYKRLVDANSSLAQRTNEHLIQFADDGLRTLTVAYKRLSRTDFLAWQTRFKSACGLVTEQEKRKHKQANLIDELMDELEQGLELLGATAIEDKLQEKVPETIKMLAEAGIKLWVLTGDKQETAINIAWACQLIDASMKRIVINSSNAKTKQDLMNMLRNQVYEPNQLYALVIDGAALKLALKDESHKVATKEEEECETLLVQLAVHMTSVVCCRVSPKQKALVVELVRRHLHKEITLGVGDGANDVGMIQSAHVGVGISGLEGMQAVNAADFALGRFYFLQRLLLLHGRNNYRRTAKLVVLILYKNIFMIIAQVCFSLFNGFSGQKFYFQLGVEGYNLIFTNSVIFTVLFDKDLPDRYLLQFPQLYELGREFQLMNFRVFWQWVVNGWFHAILSFVLVYLCYQVPGQQDIWMMGNMLLTLVMVVANVKVAMEVGSWNFWMALAYFLVFISWPVCAFIFETNLFLSIRMFWEFHHVFTSILSDLNAWLVWLLAFVALLARDIAWKGFKREFMPELRHVMGEHAKKSGKSFNDMSEVDLDLKATQTKVGTTENSEQFPV